MSFNLLDSVKGLFSNELVNKTAASLGESEGSIQKVLSGSIPTVLAGILGKSSSAEGAWGILIMAKDAAGSGILGNLGGFLGGNNSALPEKGAGMLKGLFGDKVSGITDLISSHAGVKQSSVSSILSMAAPAALGVLGNHAADVNLNAGGLMNLLSSQKSSIMNALPAGLSSIAGMLGLGSMGNTVSDVTNKASNAMHHAADTATETTVTNYRLLFTVLTGILLVGLAIYFFKGCGQGNVTSATPAEDTPVVKKDTNAVMPAGPESIKVKLPNGTELNAYKGGIEDKLVAFLNTDYSKLGADSLKKIWFDFDNLNFKTGSADLTPESQKQVDNIAAILKAFPESSIKIGGYTDKTGNEENNKKLSDARAKAVRAALNKAGVASHVSDADGYGSAFAKYPASAPESDHIKDRHVSVSVRL